MRVEKGTLTKVYVSRRNLLALLTKLDGFPPGSACSLLGGSEADGYMLVAEEDDLHYANRPAGEMHEQTERLITRPTTGTQPTF